MSRSFPGAGRVLKYLMAIRYFFSSAARLRDLNFSKKL
uniref:Uncharacterized protein n=1 Tax=Inoviridae sp. ctTUL13 TaxID=2825782 RepID=A0A8S5UQ20_9VIRU|nr:MAG TPA: hypothetical protein [Inoviridae sp. ctTUL13]